MPARPRGRLSLLLPGRLRAGHFHAKATRYFYEFETGHESANVPSLPAGGSGAFAPYGAQRSRHARQAYRSGLAAARLDGGPRLSRTDGRLHRARRQAGASACRAGRLSVACAGEPRHPGRPSRADRGQGGDEASGHGLEQARNYARRFNVPFVFSSNGHQFVFYNSTTGLTSSPAPIASSLTLTCCGRSGRRRRRSTSTRRRRRRC